MHKLLTHKELDERLRPAADDPERFEELAVAFLEELDRADADLELSDPEGWRRSSARATTTSYAEQFRADVDNIVPLDRESEADLARRIEFARLRLAKARREEGLDVEDEQQGGEGGGNPAEDAGRPAAEAEVPRRVSRRAMELHALRTEMVERNLYLVLINVERYAQSGASRLDLIQEGCVSLFRAVDGFDWRRGLLFRTYAVHWLNQAFRNYLYNNSHTVRVPVYLQKALKHINQATIRLGDPKASPDQIAETAELNRNLVSAAMTAARASYSIDMEHTEGQEGSRLRDLLVDEESADPYQPEFEDVGLNEGLEAALDDLSTRERLVLRMRFGVGYPREHTLAEVAEYLGVSVERVRQIQVRALGKLNTPRLRRDLEPFLN